MDMGGESISGVWRMGSFRLNPLPALKWLAEMGLPLSHANEFPETKLKLSYPKNDKPIMLGMTGRSEAIPAGKPVEVRGEIPLVEGYEVMISVREGVPADA
ncbi:hypothetical protein A3B57_04240 [Microgenomates group bacterium RIFCSPLOWO2_01_FULL_47_10]|nr:MAG: hypothetical protein A3B57_04240 [Microgenomates group bacterium RIFCSPLOWO2_01_FULL_47_10]